MEEVNMGDRNPNTIPLLDFAMPDPNTISSSIVRPPVEANNFQFNPVLITLFQQNQFGGRTLMIT